mmetsp:Transcript_59850/g.130128  ORF Transcript_59850/g.130128 Transcript_59850/m.130128 type:complete len:265 (+) Transcript_59850:3-797(+)
MAVWTLAEATVSLESRFAIQQLAHPTLFLRLLASLSLRLDELQRLMTTDSAQRFSAVFRSDRLAAGLCLDAQHTALVDFIADFEVWCGILEVVRVAPPHRLDTANGLDAAVWRGRRPSVVLVDTVLGLNGRSAFTLGSTATPVPLPERERQMASRVLFGAPISDTSGLASQAEWRPLLMERADHDVRHRIETHPVERRKATAEELASLDAAAQAPLSVACGVCLLGSGQGVTLFCEHAFHRGCLRDWVAQHHATCPNCRAPFAL